MTQSCFIFALAGPDMLVTLVSTRTSVKAFIFSLSPNLSFSLLLPRIGIVDNVRRR